MRTATLTKRANERRFQRGRTFAHQRFTEMKLEVAKIRQLEQQDKSDTLTQKEPKGVRLDMPEMEETYNVPMGTEFDYIYKERQELIDSQKKQNSVKMDQLVAQLGYMDYRDALACNKYIIEAKRSNDYH